MMTRFQDIELRHLNVAEIAERHAKLVAEVKRLHCEINDEQKRAKVRKPRLAALRRAHKEVLRLATKSQAVYDLRTARYNGANGASHAG